MKEALEDAIDELKRVDHLVFVSLKYTRTVDVIRLVIGRMINAYNFAMLSILRYSKEHQLINSFPTAPLQRCELVMKLFPRDEGMQGALKLYQLLKKLIVARHDKREEYRRHVTMIAHLDDGSSIEVDIDALREYYDKLKAFFHLIRNTIEGVKE